MKLKDWLDERHMAQTAFADLVGVDKGTVSRWLNGTMPQREHRTKIREVTGGQVTSDDFDDEDGPAVSSSVSASGFAAGS